MDFTARTQPMAPLHEHLLAEMPDDHQTGVEGPPTDAEGSATTPRWAHQRNVRLAVRGVHGEVPHLIAYVVKLLDLDMPRPPRERGEQVGGSPRHPDPVVGHSERDMPP